MCSITLEEETNSLLDAFTHTQLDFDKIKIFDFWSHNQTNEETEKVKIDQTFCTLVTIGKKFLEKKIFKKVMKKIDEIRKMFRKHQLKIYFCNYNCDKV